jgi:uncharacterized protein
MTVLIIGASNKKDRISYQAFHMLRDYGYTTILLHPYLKEIEGVPVLASIKSVHQPIDTVTLYVNATLSATMTDDLLKLKPRRVIFNPGTENPTLKSALMKNDTLCIEACTLILLKTNQF